MSSVAEKKTTTTTKSKTPPKTKSETKIKTAETLDETKDDSDPNAEANKEPADISASFRIAKPPESVNPSSGVNPQSGSKVDTEFVSTELPLALDFIDNAPETSNGTAFEVKLYGEGCLECKALIPSADEAQTDCHFSAGNMYCPAASIRMVFVGERMRTLARLKKAKESGDSSRFLNLLSKLNADEDVEKKNYILKELGLIF